MAPRGGGGQGPLGPRLTIWGSNILWGGGGGPRPPCPPPLDPRMVYIMCVVLAQSRACLDCYFFGGSRHPPPPPPALSAPPPPPKILRTPLNLSCFYIKKTCRPIVAYTIGYMSPTVRGPASSPGRPGHVGYKIKGINTCILLPKATHKCLFISVLGKVLHDILSQADSIRNVKAAMRGAHNDRLSTDGPAAVGAAFPGPRPDVAGSSPDPQTPEAQRSSCR